MGNPEGMRCHRCGGVMVYEPFYSSHDRCLGWRCLICGEVVDEVILENRQWIAGEPKRKKSSAKTVYEQGEGEG